jgi:sterol desaturase/sphingolipid hydroxylase (fatty acid hydroxylase superfamily)
MQKLPDPVLLAIPYFLLSMPLERWWIDRRRGAVGTASPAPARTALKGYNTKDALTSIGMGLGNLAQTIALGFLVVRALEFLYAHRIYTVPLNVSTVFAFVLLEDLAYYVFHRLGHEVRFWWAAHITHHSSQYYNLSTALRQSWMIILGLTWLPWIALPLLGFPPELIFFQKNVSLVYQFGIHTEIIRKFPRPIEWLFNTPSHHRVHHASNERYLDKNYGGILIVWDRLFGTFAEEDFEDPPVYGLTKNIASHNLAYVAFHEFIAIAKDAWRAPRWSDKFALIFGRPSQIEAVRKRAGLLESS